MARREVNYITSGRRWAWGWHRYEAQAMVGLLTVIGVSAAVGVLIGLMIGIKGHLPIPVTLLIAIGTLFLASAVGIAVTRAVIAPMWSFLVTKGQEEGA